MSVDELTQLLAASKRREERLRELLRRAIGHLGDRERAEQRAEGAAANIAHELSELLGS